MDPNQKLEGNSTMHSKVYTVLNDGMYFINSSDGEKCVDGINFLENGAFQIKVLCCGNHVQPLSIHSVVLSMLLNQAVIG